MNKRSTTFKIFISILSVFIIIILACGGILFSLLNKVDKIEIDTTKLGINHEETNKIQTEKNIKDIKNIALFGIDSEEGSAGRSDAIMIITIDSTHKKLKVTSIMRDSYVNIDGHDMDKINHAYAFGGPELAIKTINSNFGLNIEDFISVNFSSLPKIIDLLGGVDINITEEEVPHVPGIDSPGNHTLNGEQALSYARIRYAAGGDFVRTERQRTVLNSLFSKFSTLPVTSYPELIAKILPYTKTNMSSTDLISIALKGATLLENGLHQERFPRDEDAKGIMKGGVYYLSFDLPKVKKEMMNYIFNDIK